MRAALAAALAAAVGALAGGAAVGGARGGPPTPAVAHHAAPAAADSAFAAAAARGRAILAATRDSLPGHVGNALRCTSCHLDDGRRAGAMPWTGVYARFPQYRSREGDVLRLEDRINACLRRSLAGRALPHAHPAMRDMVAYMAWLSRGVPVGASVAGQGLRPVRAPLPPDTLRGRARYAAHCARCHGADGAGRTHAGREGAPPLWGPRAFTIGAGMARLHTAAAFIRHNMPLDRPGTLDDQAAADVAAWVVSRPRPDLPGKARDWPHGGAPPDAAYRTHAMAGARPASRITP